MIKFKRTVSFIVCLIYCLTIPFCAYAKSDDNSQIQETTAKSAILINTDTGDVLYKKNEFEKLSPASVTKIASLLVIMESLEKGKIKMDDIVTVGENSVEKGGSQIWLELNEKMTVKDLLKATVIASANDACNALAEHIAGSEQTFVKMMNERVKELGLKNTHFENCTGLDDTVKNHYSCAYDLAIISKELIKYDAIKNFSTIWMDYLRNGKTELTNTNKLINKYNGMTGLKTGTTSNAGFCLSATATREHTSLCAVILGAKTSEDRFNSAKQLLDYGFANFKTVYPKADEKQISYVTVKFGEIKKFKPIPEKSKCILAKTSSSDIEQEYKIKSKINAPVKKGDCVGYIIYTCDGKEIARSKLICDKNINKITVKYLFINLLKNMGC